MAEVPPPAWRPAWFNRCVQYFSSEPKNRDELKQWLKRATARRILDSPSYTMIEGVLGMSTLRIRDIMVPRPQMIVLQADLTLPSLIQMITKSVHSRFPVIGPHQDEVLGLLLAKDLLQWFGSTHETQPFNLESILRPAMIVPESKRLDGLLQEFRQRHSHMAIVVDEYGGVTGLITIEDVLEEIVGEIEDEYDVSHNKLIKKYKNNTYTLNAHTSIEDFNHYFNADLQATDVESVGGLVLRHMGHLPKRGETVEIGDFHFRVMRADKRRIDLLQVTPNLPSEPAKL